MWFHKLGESLHTLGFSPTKFDYALFFKNEGSFVTYIFNYVDDFLIKGNNLARITKLKVDLTKKIHKTEGFGKTEIFPWTLIC